MYLGASQMLIPWQKQYRLLFSHNRYFHIWGNSTWTGSAATEWIMSQFQSTWCENETIKWIQCTMGLSRFDLRVDMDSDPQHCSEHHISIVVTVRKLLPISFWWQLLEPCKPHPGHEFSSKQTQVTLERNSQSASVWSFWVEERLFSSGLQKASTVPW